MRESVESVLDAEQELDSFVDKLGTALEEIEDRDACPNISVVGSQLPSSLRLVDARSGEVVTLESYWRRNPFTHLVLFRQFA